MVSILVGLPENAAGSSASRVFVAQSLVLDSIYTTQSPYAYFCTAVIGCVALAIMFKEKYERI